jgi:DNA mismatch endonuclease (patch repair protein)
MASRANHSINKMSDIHTPEQRHKNMAAIRAKNTKPEILVRKFLWSHGYRYRLNHPRLPGKPDIVLRKYRTCIFVNGCFWHKHEGCKYFVVPKTRTEFWLNKINRNQERDKEVKKQLAKMGWHSITIWECELKPSKKDNTLESLLYTLNKIFLLNYRVKPYKIVEKEMFMNVAENSDVENGKITEK